MPFASASEPYSTIAIHAFAISKESIRNARIFPRAPDGIILSLIPDVNGLYNHFAWGHHAQVANIRWQHISVDLNSCGLNMFGKARYFLWIEQMTYQNRACIWPRPSNGSRDMLRSLNIDFIFGTMR